jgi:ankyrin repeat protein
MRHRWPHCQYHGQRAGAERQINDECLIGQQIEELETAVDKATQTQRWIFIDAKQLQREIDEGWDVITHGGEYARQAVEWDDPEVLRVLVKNGVSVETVAYDGESLLQRAVTANRYASVKMLLELGANPRALNSDGWGPSQNAGNRSVEMCKLFLKHGAGLDDQDGLGETMLMNASNLPSNFEIVKFLVALGANVNLRSKDGETAVGVAMRMRAQNRGSIDFTWDPNFSRFVGDPEVARASYMATQKEYEKVIEYIRQHGGIE